MDDLIIRPARPGDAAALLEIYEYYVNHTAVTFEYDAPSEDEFRHRIENTLRRYPYLAAEVNGKIVGYAYAGAFKNRAAYDWSVEVTVYLSPDMRRRGIGRALYGELERQLGEMGILNLYACIAVPAGEDDEYLNHDSVDFHARMGYAVAGRFRRCGYKFGRWYDMVWMEKMIGGHLPDTKPVRWRKG